MKKIKKNFIGILGGSFDPPHKGHVEISKISFKKWTTYRRTVNFSPNDG